ncbi:hypothetical protein Taro_025866 [Colocasia esculenta]|uniref:non-specific serine/threonine protein kinase n=1 Tax=Colocasia esculenta TaxID=4460 RepID=A0A843VFH0_COLES|nr:hypothetical protein [Colocasia esculenta]
MLLELLAARRPIEKGTYVVTVVKASIDRTKDLYDLSGLVDPSIRMNTSICGFEKFVDLAMRCVEDLGVHRPAMSQVVKEIEGIMLSVGMDPNSESSQTSASYEGGKRDYGGLQAYNEEIFDYSVAAALVSLRDSWTNKPPGWTGSDPCGNQWDGINCNGSRITSITLSNTGLQGELSGDIGSLTELQTLDLSYNVNLTGPLPHSIGSLTNLTSLVLDGCSFNGPIPDLGNLQKLFTLSLSSNQFSGQIPPSIGRLSNLYVLDITDNKLTGSIPVSPGLDMLISCRHFHCGKNQLSGSIPEGLFRPKMQIIHVLFDNNNLSGTIPSSLGLVKKLEVVRLDRNSITGPVPNNINSLTNLRELHLSNNKLNGSLPNLTGMELLSYVDLSNNSFDPSNVPPWFSTLTSLTTIVMDNTRIRNSLAHDLFTQPQIQIVQLRNNFLNGTVDLGTTYGSKLRLVDLRNNSIEDVHGGGEEKPRLILAGNPYCDKRGRENSHCEIPQQLDSYSTPTSKCQQIVCSPDQKLSPDCRCGYPYVGNLFFFYFSNLMDDSNYEALVKSMTYYFRSHGVPVDSVALHDVTISSENYLQIGLQIFPSGATCFNQSSYSNISSILSGQMHDALKGFGSYNFHVGVYDCGEGWMYTSKSKNLLVIIGASIGVFILAVTIITLVVYAARLKRKAQRVVERRGPFASWERVKGGGDAPRIRGPKWFSFDELKRSTKNFSEANEIGTGSYGKVHHRKSGIHLDWRRRLKIALGISRGLAYLHELADPPIIHRDVKSNNILLDDCLNAKIADFGLCKPMSDGLQDHVTTQVKGTMGYMDPEYYMTQQLTEKSDVYSFGVLLLELLTARRPIEKGKYVVTVVKGLMDRTKDLYNLSGLVDPLIRMNTSICGFEKFVDLAMRCVEDLGVDRPAMSQVLKEIEGIMLSAGVDPNSESSQTSESYEGGKRDYGGLHVYNEEIFDYSVGMSSSGEPKSLNSNQFSRQIPPSIGRLPNLYVLDIADNRLTSNILISLGLDMLINCRHLFVEHFLREHFHCGKNQLPSSIPKGLFRQKM